MPITALYAALLGLVLLVLSFRVIAVRLKEKVSLGDGDKPVLEKRIRAHANFAEYTPLCLILIGLAESLHAPHLALHGLGASLLAGRILHGYGISQTPQFIPGRFIGMNLTFAVLAAGAGLNLWLALPALK